MNDVITESQKIELSIKAAETKIKKAEQLDRLMANDDFQSFIMEGFLKEYATNLVHLKASMGCQDEKNQSYINNQINAIGYFNLYLLLIKQEADIAKESMKEDFKEQAAILDEVS